MDCFDPLIGKEVKNKISVRKFFTKILLIICNIMKTLWAGLHETVIVFSLLAETRVFLIMKEEQNNYSCSIHYEQ